MSEWKEYNLDECMTSVRGFQKELPNLGLGTDF